MPKILVVDDNEDNRDSLSRRLMRRGFAVETADDGNSALARVEADKPDLILMDMNMPGLDGWEATKQLRKNPESAAIPIIGLTAYALEGDRQRALEAGCSDYHTKPVEFAKLIEQIGHFLQQSSPLSPEGSSQESS